jgi:aryl-alcohol dehydrogenase-like predicted oxidoreductase/histidinol phosphatase-like enzyme
MWGDDIHLVAIGGMRLSTDPARDAERAIATLHAAFDAGVNLIDTADAYALDASEAGHNERLIAAAVAAWPGERARIRIATKGGLTRPDGRWLPDGRARHLQAACQHSRESLAVSRIALYQLHASDPRVTWTTSVRAIAALHRSGAIEAAGLCNVTVKQIEAARSIVPIATVQAELNPWKDRAITSGVVEYCRKHGIRLLAFRPFGGGGGVRRVARDDLLKEIAGARRVSPSAVVLAWMRGLAPHLTPLPGPTRPETAVDCARGQLLTLDDGEQTALDRHFVIGRIRTSAPSWRRPDMRANAIERSPGGAVGRGTDIVMIMGLPGAGKSTRAAAMVADGFVRLNRDELGGSLGALVPKLTALLADDSARIVLDNTYLSRASRAPILDVARAHGRGVHGVWLETGIEDAQVNIVSRMLRSHGRLLASDELKATGRPDRLSPMALFRAQRELELPDASEGFTTLDVVPYIRQHDAGFSNRALILWSDGVIRPPRTQSTRDTPPWNDDLLAERRALLARYQAEGWRLLALSWEPQIAEHAATAAQVDEELARLRDRLRLDLEFHYCPHGAGPPVCWCRKPLPGLGVLLIRRYQLDPRQCLYVGSTPQDPPFARRLGFEYRAADEFFRG